MSTISSPGVDAVCIGETMALVSPDPVMSLLEARTFVLAHGGAESNVAVSLARLGSRVQWCSRLGDDTLGRRVEAQIRAAGVDTSLVCLDPDRRTGVYFKDPAPEATRVLYYRDGSAASRIDDSDFRRAVHSEPRLLHLSGVTPALSASCLQACRRGVEAARNARVTVSFDVNYRPVLWSSPAAAAQALADIARRCDIVFVGVDEAEALWGTASMDAIAGHLPDVPTLIVKDGQAPAHSVERGNLVSVPALPVQVCEPVGAGDAFAAGWLRGYLLGFDPLSRLRLGHILAAQTLSSTTDHATDWPSVAELESWARHGAGWPAAAHRELTKQDA